MKPSVTLVGAGSGDPNIFTLGGKIALEQCDVVVYDRLISQEILDMIPEDVEKIDVGKMAGNHTLPQEEINQLLLELALSGKSVVRLKGGDNFLFGRGGEELKLLVEHQVPFSVIPGVSSPFAASAYGGFPLTHRDHSSSVHIFSGHKKSHLGNSFDYKSMVSLGGTLVFLMAKTKILNILEGLLAYGLDESMPVCVVEHGTLSSQRVIKGTAKEFLITAQREEFLSPSIFFVGSVCALDYPWFVGGSLQGKHILLSSPVEKDGDLCVKLQKEGATPHIFAHLIEEEMAFTLPSLSQGDMLIFTSKRGVDAFFEKVYSLAYDARFFHGIEFAVVGHGTKNHLKKYGIFADFMPSESNSSVFAEELLRYPLKGKFFLIQGEPHTFDLQEQFEKHEKNHEIVTTYKINYQKVTISNEINYDMVAFTSGASVKKFVEYYPDLLGTIALCMGKTTEKIAKQNGFQTITAETTTNDSMIDKMKEYFHDSKT